MRWPSDDPDQRRKSDAAFPRGDGAAAADPGRLWVFVQGAGLDPAALAASVCNWGMVPGELTHRARVGDGLPSGNGMACVVDDEPRNLLTPITSMFLHGGWAHLLGNGLFLWIFGNNVEDSMGRIRFIVFYLVCGLAAAAAQVADQSGVDRYPWWARLAPSPACWGRT